MGRKKEESLGEMLIGLASVGILIMSGYVVMKTNSFVAGGVAFGVAFAVLYGVVKVTSDMKHAAEQERLRRSGIAEIDRMDGHQFERYLGALFSSQGYKVKVTQASSDYGADMILQKEGKTIAVQAKRHSKNIGIDAVQQVQAAIAHYKTNDAWVVSNRHYTVNAKNLAASNNVRLIDRDELIKMSTVFRDRIKTSSQKSNAQQPIVKQPPVQQTKTCNVCGGKMVVKKMAVGTFYLCSNYPACKHREPFPGNSNDKR